MVDVDKPVAPVPTERRAIQEAKSIPNAAIFLRRTALEFLQVLFSERAPGAFRYDADDSVTEIRICDVHAVDLNTVNTRPAIIAVRGPLSWQGLGIGGSAIAGRKISTGAHQFSDLLTGSVAFSCVSREGIEAEQIGHLVFNSFKWFRPVLQQYGFFTIKSLNIGAESLVESEGSDDKTTIVPVYITAQIQDRWLLEEKVGRKLREIITEHFVTITT